MPNKTVELKAPSGLSLTLSLYAFGSDSLANNGGADTLSERTNAKGIYAATVTEAISGWHDAKVLDGSGNLIASYVVNLTDAVGTYRCCDLIDMYAVAGDTEAVDDLKASIKTVVRGTVSDAHTAPTTSLFAAADITEATGDHFLGRVIIFTSGALKDQATDITAYALVSGEGAFTVTAMTDAPANGDTFVIV